MDNIIYIVKYLIDCIRTTFMKSCWYLLLKGINPYKVNLKTICCELDVYELQKFIKLCPKKHREDILKEFIKIKGYDIMD